MNFEIVFSGLNHRSRNIEIMLANNISKNLVKEVGENNIPWNEFHSCGKISSSTTDIVSTVHCAKVDIHVNILDVYKLFLKILESTQ